jgi:hypothetical protein
MAFKFRRYINNINISIITQIIIRESKVSQILINSSKVASSIKYTIVK